MAGKTALAEECFDLLFVFDRRVGFVRALLGGLRLGAERNRSKHAQPSHEPRAQDQGFGTAQGHFHGRSSALRRWEIGSGPWSWGDIGLYSISHSVVP